MNLEQWTVMAIFVGTLIGLISFQKFPERVFAVACLACLGFSFISKDELLHNAVNPGLATLLLLVISSFAFERTSLLRRLSAILFNGSKTKSYFKTLVGTALASGLLNNTAVVVTLINPVKNNTLINPGKLLLPLSYAAILGGTLTLIGTSTNLIVNSMLLERGQVGFSFFDFTQVGIVVLICCLSVMALTIRFLPVSDIEQQQLHHYFVEAEVTAASSLCGQSVEENGLRNLESLFLVEIIRQGRLITPIAPSEVIQAQDKLIFSGDVSKVKVLRQFDGLTTFAEEDGLLRDNLIEVVIKPGASVIGKTLKTAGFRARFDAAVVAIRREGEQLSGKLGDIAIQSGDFLVLAVGHDFAERPNLAKNFYVISDVVTANMLSGIKEKIVLWGFAISVLSSVVLELSLFSCFLFYLALLTATKCLSLNEVKRRLPIELWIIVTSALCLATALDNSGITALLADAADQYLHDKSVYIAFIGVYLMTLVLTELITNNGAAALTFPIAFSIASGLDVSYFPFVMAVAFGASGSFISPYGYQTNLMVFNAGNYKLIDFVKFGLPVSIIYSLAVIVMIPIVFPF
ncbi:SLC13 family permease [Shewanella hanedai]|uniref:SLC13 family permease n=1 Tax=Shewanella hanedai TaxID=25 RepID=A0A553JMR5_SHEHA|nr:SLC13 family permease [Shewanella hanedai]TRY13690.1 SLC13 family permease [Shewanella hanedai]GGI98687.1 SLC13 family permease [Shewanella hanedai]